MVDEDSSLKDASAQARLMDELGLKLNDKIEVRMRHGGVAKGVNTQVRWLIERDDQPTETKVRKSGKCVQAIDSVVQWWGARLVESDAESKEVTLLYDAVDDFAATRNRVMFLSESAPFMESSVSPVFQRFCTTSKKATNCRIDEKAS